MVRKKKKKKHKKLSKEQKILIYSILFILLLLGLIILIVYLATKKHSPGPHPAPAPAPGPGPAPYALGNIVGLNMNYVKTAWQFLYGLKLNINGIMGWAANLYFKDYSAANGYGGTAPPRGRVGSLPGASCAYTYPVGHLVLASLNPPMVPRTWGSFSFSGGEKRGVDKPNDIIVYYNTSAAACDSGPKGTAPSGEASGAPGCQYGKTTDCCSGGWSCGSSPPNWYHKTGGAKPGIPCGGRSYIFTPAELKTSGYTIIADAFWTNYPWCWAHGPGGPKGKWSQSTHGTCSTSPLLANRPEWNIVPGVTGVANGCTLSTWISKLLPGKVAGITDIKDISTNYISLKDYSAFYQSLHQTYIASSIFLRQNIITCKLNYKVDIKFLASIGGWNMGATKAGKNFSSEWPYTNRDMPSPVPAAWPPLVPPKANWMACLQQPKFFADQVMQMMNLRVPNITQNSPANPTGQVYQQPKVIGNGANLPPLYDGFDIDCESQFAGGTLVTATITNFVTFYTQMVTYNTRTIIMMAAPRLADLLCNRKRCKSWYLNYKPQSPYIYTGKNNNVYILGFFGRVLVELANQGIYLDHINPQCYNDLNTNSFPNCRSGNKKFPLTQNSDMVEILDILLTKVTDEKGNLIFNRTNSSSARKNGNGPTKLNVGVLMQGGHKTDRPVSYSTWVDSGGCAKISKKDE